MRKILTLSILGLWALTVSASASLAVYKQKLTITTTGGGAVVKKTVAGWLVLQVSESQTRAMFVNVDAKKGIFQFQYPDGYEVKNVSAGLGKDSLVMTFSGSGSGSLGMKGANTSIDLFANDVWRLPKTMSASGVILRESDGVTFSEECKGTFVFSAKDASEANVFTDGTLEGAESTLRESYLDLGYTEAP